MSSIDSTAAGSTRTSLGIREEPLRGMNATMKTKEDEKTKAVLQVVESSELAPGDDTLVLQGKILVNVALARTQSCNIAAYSAKHGVVFAGAVADGVVKELALRYAMTLAAGNWGWRNALESDTITVAVHWTAAKEAHRATFTDFLLADENTFDIEQPQYADHKPAILELAGAIEAAFTRKGPGFGTIFTVTGMFRMGIGARVYPSQEWASTLMQAASKANWEGGKGVTRTLAKLTKNGLPQAIINNRKVGNALRTIDTWYADDVQGAPIAAEPFGASSHQNVAHRSSDKLSLFGMVKSINDGVKLTREQVLFYMACVIRGGVYGGKEKE